MDPRNPHIHLAPSGPQICIMYPYIHVCVCVYTYVFSPPPPPFLSPSPTPVIAQYHEVAELAEATGRKMYVDPSIYASADEAVRDFAKEIPPKFLSMKEEIGRGKLLNI